MEEEAPSPLDLLAAAIRDDPEAWLPLDNRDLSSERAAELAGRITGPEPAGDREDNPVNQQVEPVLSSSPRGRYLLVAAVILVVTGVSIALFGPREPSAQAAVSGAAEALSDIGSLEGNLTRSSPSHTSESMFQANADGFHVRSEGRYSDGHVETSEQVFIDGYLYETIDGQTTRMPANPDQLPAPFASSSAAVIGAAVTGSDVEAVGSADLRDVTATRYDIQLGPDSVEALSKLDPRELAWFELEYPDQVDTMRLWIADGLVRQVEIRSGDQLTRIEFTNLGESVRIEAPPGPYVD